MVLIRYNFENLTSFTAVLQDTCDSNAKIDACTQIANAECKSNTCTCSDGYYVKDLEIKCGKPAILSYSKIYNQLHQEIIAVRGVYYWSRVSSFCGYDL